MKAGARSPARPRRNSADRSAEPLATMKEVYRVLMGPARHDSASDLATFRGSEIRSTTARLRAQIARLESVGRAK